MFPYYNLTVQVYKYVGKYLPTGKNSEKIHKKLKIIKKCLENYIKKAKKMKKINFC